MLVTWRNQIGSGPESSMDYLQSNCPLSSSDTLPTPKAVENKIWCLMSLVQIKLSVLYILNFCPTVLNQKRFTWGHDSVLLKLFSFMRSFLEDKDVLYIDLPGKHASENPSSTVPVSILVTTARPDMVLIRNMVITLIEITVPYDFRENLRNARARKSQKSSYLELLDDLEAKGYSALLVTCEISLGYYLPICRHS